MPHGRHVGTSAARPARALGLAGHRRAPRALRMQFEVGRPFASRFRGLHIPRGAAGEALHARATALVSLSLPAASLIAPLRRPLRATLAGGGLLLQSRRARRHAKHGPVLGHVEPRSARSRVGCAAPRRGSGPPGDGVCATVRGGERGVQHVRAVGERGAAASLRLRHKGATGGSAVADPAAAPSRAARAPTQGCACRSQANPHNVARLRASRLAAAVDCGDERRAGATHRLRLLSAFGVLPLNRERLSCGACARPNALA